MIRVFHEFPRFVARLDSVELGELLYVMKGNAMDLQHTFVSSSGRGKGIGNLLVDAACDEAKQKKHSVIASCSFISDKYFLTPPLGWTYDAKTKTASFTLSSKTINDGGPEP